MKEVIEISTSTILRFILIILGIGLLYLIRDVILILFVAVIITSAVDGPVDWLQKHRVRRIFGVAMIYLAFFAFLGLLIFLVVPPLAHEVKLLALNFPDYWDRLSSDFTILSEKSGFSDSIQAILNKFGDHLNGWASNAFSTTVGIFGGVFKFLIIIVISIYFSIREKGIKKFFIAVTPQGQQTYAVSLIDRIQAKLGGWLRGQILLSFIIGLLVFIGLSIFKIKYALVLALIAGVLEIVPYIGPIIAGTIAVVLVFIQSPILALFTLITFYVIQELEKYVITPQIMGRMVGLDPVVVIIAALIGAELAGIFGIIISVPIAAGLSVFLRDIFIERKS